MKFCLPRRYENKSKIEYLRQAYRLSVKVFKEKVGKHRCVHPRDCWHTAGTLVQSGLHHTQGNGDTRCWTNMPEILNQIYFITFYHQNSKMLDMSSKSIRFTQYNLIEGCQFSFPPKKTFYLRHRQQMILTLRKKIEPTMPDLICVIISQTS